MDKLVGNGIVSFLFFIFAACFYAWCACVASYLFEVHSWEANNLPVWRENTSKVRAGTKPRELIKAVELGRNSGNGCDKGEQSERNNLDHCERGKDWDNQQRELEGVGGRAERGEGRRVGS